jgi:hypothetical protein
MTSFYILVSTDENSFDLDSVDKVPNIRANLADDLSVWPKKVFVTASVTVCWSRKVKFEHSSNHKEHNRK